MTVDPVSPNPSLEKSVPKVSQVTSRSHLEVPGSEVVATQVADLSVSTSAHHREVEARCPLALVVVTEAASGGPPAPAGQLPKVLAERTRLPRLALMLE